MDGNFKYKNFLKPGKSPAFKICQVFYFLDKYKLLW